MIEHITIRNFKSIGKVGVDLSPVTVLIGRSGVGKSNFLRALRFLRNFLRTGEQAISLEGGWERIWPFGVAAPLSFDVRFAIPGFDSTFEYHVAWNAPTPPDAGAQAAARAAGRHHLGAPGDTTLAVERLTLGRETVFSRRGRTWEKWPQEGPGPTPAPQSYLGSFPTLSEAVLAYTAWTSGIGWHDFPANVFAQPSQARGLTAQRNAQAVGQRDGLNDTASNYLQVIRDITKDLRDQTSRRQILARLKQINPTVDAIELDSILNPQRVVVTHKVGDRRIGLDLSQESDGFRRYYAHLLALYQTPPKQLLMFEEPENGVYPGALRNLAEEFDAASDGGRGQVLLTTQSPDLLDGFKPEQLRVVELDEKQMTRVSPLDPDQADALRQHLLEPGELLTVDTARGAATTA